MCIRDRTRETRTALNLIEKLAKIAKSEAGLQVWQQDRIDILKTLPTEEFNYFSGEKWRQFREMRLPQLFTEIANKRERYRQIIEQQTLRKQNLNPKNHDDFEL